MRLDGYTLGEPLGKGATATVYAARHEASGEAVAIKLFVAGRGLDPRTRQRVQRELSSLSRLEHPHLVRVRDSGQVEGRLYLVMDLVRGETLQARLDRDGPLEPAVTRGLLRALATAVDYAHRCGVVHRDIKPDNVLLAAEGPRLTDFGLALDLHQEGERLTQTGVLMGTPGYLAPEQAGGLRDDVGKPTDVYGLGGVFYACLTGGPPVGGATLQELLGATLQGRITPPRELRPEVDPELEALCLACLATDGSRRPTAEQLARQLAGAAQVAPRARWPVVLAAGVLCALLVGGWLLLRGSERAPPERVAAIQALRKAHFDEVRGAAERLIADYPREPRGHFYLALACAGEGAWEQALPHLQRVHALDPDDAEAWGLEGRAYDTLQQTERAVEALSRAVALEPETYLILRATLYNRHDQLEPAAADLREQVRLTPKDWEAWRFLGDVLTDLEDYAEAEQALDTALALAPADGLAHAYRLRSRVRRARKDFEGALEDITACAQAAGGWKLDQVATRGALLVELERWREAAAAYREALELYPASVSYAFNLYRLERKLGNHEAALGYLDQAYARSQEGGATPQLKRLIEETWLEARHR